VGLCREAVHREFAERQVHQSVEGVGAVAVPAMLSSQHQLDLCCAVDDVLAGQCDVADGGAVGEQDDEVVAIGASSLSRSMRSRVAVRQRGQMPIS
jgi:hypothetical protein